MVVGGNAWDFMWCSSPCIQPWHFSSLRHGDGVVWLFDSSAVLAGEGENIDAISACQPIDAQTSKRATAQ